MCRVRLLWRWPLPKIHRPCPTGLQAQGCFWGLPLNWSSLPCWSGWCELKIFLHFDLFLILKIALETAAWPLREWQLRATSIHHLQPPAVKEFHQFPILPSTWRWAEHDIHKLIQRDRGRVYGRGQGSYSQRQWPKRLQMPGISVLMVLSLTIVQRWRTFADLAICELHVSEFP